MANSCLAALRLACPKLTDASVAMQLKLQHASVFFPRAARRPHSHHLQQQRRVLRAVTAMVSQEEAAATAVERLEEEEEEEEEEQPREEEEEEDGAPQEEEQVGILEASAGGVEAPAAAASSTKLYFGNLPYNCDSAQLAAIVQDYATPEMVEVLYDRTTGRSRGFAFVTMTTIEDCERVIKNLDGSQYSGRTMKVNLADKPKPKLPLYPETEHKLFVGNLSWTVTGEMLAETFQQCGKVVGARVLYDGDTGRSRGYGFVCYSTKEEMDEALSSLDGTELEGREIRVNPALGKN